MKISRLFAVAAALSLALGGCATVPGTSSKGLEAPIEKAALKFASDVREGGYKTVSTDELKKWLDDGKTMTLISALPESDDQAIGRLPGAVNGAMPKTEKELTQADKDRFLKAAGLDKEKPVVVYCGFVACRRSHLGAKTLVENGYLSVYRYPGGTTAWQQSGFPLVK